MIHSKYTLLTCPHCSHEQDDPVEEYVIHTLLGAELLSTDRCDYCDGWFEVIPLGDGQYDVIPERE